MNQMSVPPEEATVTALDLDDRVAMSDVLGIETGQGQDAR